MRVSPSKPGDKLCGTRVIPLVIARERMERAKAMVGTEPLLKLLPMRPKRYGLVVTGSEVFHGRIRDTFTGVILEKLGEYGCEMAFHTVLDDDPAAITAAITDMLDRGAELVLCTGGMSVDPDDHTPLAIRNTGADVISYGSSRTAGRHVSGGLHGGRPAHLRPARLCDVRQAHHLRSGAAPASGGCADHGRLVGRAGAGGTVPGLSCVPFPQLRLWKRGIDPCVFPILTPTGTP